MKDQIATINQTGESLHKTSFELLATGLSSLNIDVDAIIHELQSFQVAIPSWALGAGGTRFGRYGFGGEPSSLHEKIDDVSILHQLTGNAGAISLHIPWDIPADASEIKDYADERDIIFDAVNSNTFQDQPNQSHSYKFGSLCNESASIRQQAIEHNKRVIDIGASLGSKSITIWLADGSSFPGQMNFRRALDHTTSSLKDIYGHLPGDWKMFIEYKPYEPHFYHTVISDWGTSMMLANTCGPKASTLVDLGHHLPNTNIEQVVATLMNCGKLGGFHFNDSKYGDDDITVGSIKPFQLFLIFNELVYGMKYAKIKTSELAWMIDASHNLKDPLEDLLQSLDAILIAYGKALLIDQKKLKDAQEVHDVVFCQEILQQAFQTDVRPLVRESRLRKGHSIEPIQAFRSMGVRERLIKERGSESRATGL
jgi:L-rhamnose isomerase/sugar isomerase